VLVIVYIVHFTAISLYSTVIVGGNEEKLQPVTMGYALNNRAPLTRIPSLYSGTTGYQPGGIPVFHMACQPPGPNTRPKSSTQINHIQKLYKYYIFT